MTNLPARADIVDPNRTVAQAQDDRGDVRDVVSELRGGSGEETLTLAGDAITPTRATVRIDTEGQTATDDLRQIVQTNHPDGRELVLLAADPGRKVLVRNLSGGAGQIQTLAGRDVLLQKRFCMIVRRVATRWLQLYETRIAAGAVGQVGYTASAAAPPGGILCYGQLIATADEPELFAELGYTFGGSGAQFGLPDLRDRTTIGKGDMGGTPAGRITNTGDGNPGIDTSVLGASGGVDRHQLTEAQLAQVTPGLTDPGHPHTTNARALSGAGGLQAGGTAFSDAAVANANTTGISANALGGDQAHPNVQPGQVLNAFIWT